MFANPEEVEQFQTMKTRLFLLILLALATQPLQASYFDEIKGNLTGPVAGSPKYTALYFSAHWCPPCRMFTPKLVDWYKEFKAKHPDFELVFVSSDQDQAAMDKYIKEAEMPWPVAKFDAADTDIFRKYSSTGIPYVVLIDENGKDLTGKPGNDWQAPTEVLSKIEKIVGGN
jgi:nucleoredoxin